LIAVLGPLLKARQAIEQQTDDLDPVFSAKGFQPG